MLSRIATLSGLLAVSWFTSVGAERTGPVRISSRADDYLWTVKWTGPSICTSWPCGYSYEVSGPTYTAEAGAIPFIDATCVGIVDQPLVACTLFSAQASSAVMTVSGNFSTYETSGVGNGLIDITATWQDQATGKARTLTGVTPLQATAANQNTWTVEPEGCPVSNCAAVNATKAARRGAWGLRI
ncbi:hypothetical protein GGS24DRAFT_449415 [Hypoxylon argillaceum]|nr:hypothetical protein GGS24DRAFT_449415 [Hypoxylon argillaceum]KAI1152657.1 hypothetical protein F4825DRAFT_418307 [Nemania diffusa]